MKKDYSEIYVSLREEIMQAIVSKVDDILDKYDVDNLSDLDSQPYLSGYVTETDKDSGTVKHTFVVLIDIWSGGKCAGYPVGGSAAIPGCYELHEFVTDSLIEFYEILSKYGN